MKYITISVVFVMFLFISCVSVDAAKRDFKFEKIDFRHRTISAEGTTIKGLDKGKLRFLGKPQEWGVVEGIYESLPDWADDVELRYYVLLRARRAKKQVMLVGSITYIDVEKGKHHVSNIYIPPQVLRRYGEVLRVRSEIWYNGVLQDEAQWPRKKKDSKIPWWTRIKSTYGSLMNRFYTPFEHEEQLREELIKIQ